MASTYKPTTPTRSEVASQSPPCRVNFFAVDVALRVLLFAASLSAVIDMVTSKQTKLVAVPGSTFSLEIPSKFNQIPAFVYFVAALSVACLYSIITSLVSLSVILKPAFPKSCLLLLAFWDVLMLGVVASATGASGAVAYIGLKGNNHAGWAEICSVYDRFCRHVGSATAISLFASILLVMLSALSTYSLYKRVRD